MTADTYLRRSRRRFRCFLQRPGIANCLDGLFYIAAGFFVSAAGIRQTFQPLSMGLIAVLSGWRAIAMTLGSMLGYRFFWGQAGIQGCVFSAAAGMLALILGKQKNIREEPLLLSMICGAMMAAIGLFYQAVYRSDTEVSAYFLRICLAAASAALGNQLVYHRDPFCQWAAGGVAALSLAQVLPIPYMSLGYIAAGCITVLGSFPAAALAGLGLDLSQTTPLPMTAVMAMAYFLRLIPFSDRWLRYFSPAAAYLLTAFLWDTWDPVPLPGLILGGGLAMLLPTPRLNSFRRGSTGAAQVRLELAARAMMQIQRIFLEQPEPDIDRQALLEKAKGRACQHCPYQKECTVKNHLKAEMLKNPLSAACKKTGRLVTELQRSSEQMKVMQLGRHRRQEFRSAMIQQYGFLARYLGYLSDQLPRQGEKKKASYCVQVSARSHRKEQANGDCCLAFPGVGCRYYVVLCDGMGTGLGAAEEGRNAAYLLKQMLKSGFPPEFALQNINSLLVLRGQAGAVTVDLTELRLDTGKAAVYKWGAAPSWIIKEGRPSKLGLPTPPPGISMEETRKPLRCLSLARGEVLVLLSDGVDGTAAMRQLQWNPQISTGFLADQILRNGCEKNDDDATAAVIRLRPAPLAT